MIKPKIITNFPIASESSDHKIPDSVKNDNTKNGIFVRQLIRKFGKDMKYMDLGCAGGGFVSQFLYNNILAVGIEGSDYCLKNQTGEWEKYPDYFFTADIAKPFYIVDEEHKKINFDVISAFDVMEHIHKPGLDCTMHNIVAALNPNGIFIAGIATFPDGDYHVTLEEKPWWHELISSYDLLLVEDEAAYENFGRSSSIDVIYQKR